MLQIEEVILWIVVAAISSPFFGHHSILQVGPLLVYHDYISLFVAPRFVRTQYMNFRRKST